MNGKEIRYRRILKINFTEMIYWDDLYMFYFVTIEFMKMLGLGL